MPSGGVKTAVASSARRSDVARFQIACGSPGEFGKSYSTTKRVVSWWMRHDVAGGCIPSLTFPISTSAGTRDVLGRHNNGGTSGFYNSGSSTYDLNLWLGGTDYNWHRHEIDIQDLLTQFTPGVTFNSVTAISTRGSYYSDLLSAQPKGQESDRVDQPDPMR